MKKIFLLFFSLTTATILHTASNRNSNELINLATETRTAVTEHDIAELNCLWSLPCATQKTLDFSSGTCIPRAEYKKKFDTVFNPTLTEQGNSAKKFCIEYLRKAGTKTGCCLGSTVTSTFLCALCSTICWSCFSNAEPPCASFFDCMLPYECTDQPCCVSTNGLNVLAFSGTMLGIIGAPFCGAGADVGCILCLADPACCSKDSSKPKQHTLELEDDSEYQ